MMTNNINQIELSAKEICKKETFSDRVQIILDSQKRTRAWLAEELGITKQALNYILNHSKEHKYLSEVAFALGVNQEWLATGVGNIHAIEERASVRPIPIYDTCNFAENVKMSRFKDTILVDGHYPEHCFGVILNDSSMEPVFQKESILIFDPDKSPRTEDYVIFNSGDDGVVIFRQFINDGEKAYFKANNHLYKTVYSNKANKVYGVLIESRIML